MHTRQHSFVTSITECILTSLVGSEVGGEVIDVDENTRFVLTEVKRSQQCLAGTICCTYAGVHSRDGDKRARCAAAAVDDVKLGTTDVELGTSVALSDVKSNLDAIGEKKRLEKQ